MYMCTLTDWNSGQQYMTIVHSKADIEVAIRNFISGLKDKFGIGYEPVIDISL